MTYEKALKDFSKLVTVNRDDLDGTIDHLVYRAQHEIDLEDEGDMYESIEEIWPDYPSREDFLFNEDEY